MKTTFDIPPLETPIMFLAGEFGCIPHWYCGFAWKSSAEGQELKFYIYPEFLGYPRNNPPFNAPPYCGKYFKVKDADILAEIDMERKPQFKQLSLNGGPQ